MRRRRLGRQRTRLSPGHTRRTSSLRIVRTNAIANYRKAFAHGGGKSDPVNAKLIYQYLDHYRANLRPLSPNESLTRELAALTKDRRQLVHKRVELSNELKETLKSYFPAILALKPAKMYADFVVALLLKYPTLKQAQSAGKARLRKLFFGVGTKARIEERLEILMEAQPLSNDEVLLRTGSLRVRAICDQLKSLNGSIRNYDRLIKSRVKEHVDYCVVAKLPGASDKTQARMIAALGDDRSRYKNAASLQYAAGIAPLTTQSGKQKYVSSRWACTKFMKQTFHEFAGLSIGHSRWAKVFYEAQLKKGKTPQMARRALAYKWMRIIFVCWQNHCAYDEAKYIQGLKSASSPLYDVMFPNTKKAA